VVVDVGAGEGALTVRLLAAGAHVIAVERHPRRAENLRECFADQQVTVVNADVTRLRWPRFPFRVVANPPYAVTNALLRTLLSPHNRLLSADLVLQRRVVRQVLDGRVAAARRNRGSFTMQRGLTVPRTAFRPPPRVDSAVLVILRR
jgi:23S rRNA (adenine-N6)-dimethyltransferase